MLKVSRSSALLLACALAVPLVGCAHGKGKGDTNYVARDVSSLYGAAQRTMNSGNYLQAAKLFDEVERQHPYSSWARHAQVMSAFNYYLAQKYNDAISSAQRFLTIHPGSDEAPYAQYIVAMSYYQQITDISRDQSVTQQANEAFGELVRRYPESRYAADARLKMDLIRDHLAGKDMEIGRYYQRAGQWLAATYRFRNVVDNFQTSSHAPEALERLVECYLALGIPDEAWKAAAVLGKNYPETYWYRQSLRLLAAERDHTHGKAFGTTAAAEPAPKAAKGRKR
ncbi:MAG TPA: outer membrane protein assembly factor BamD [Sphingomicrobium sp.]|jgi:outer membrane protein assembly factor BamD|nr:outer membrane protein assembly factor BamD [Sphingomicrobium sp.]